MPEQLGEAPGRRGPGVAEGPGVHVEGGEEGLEGSLEARGVQGGWCPGRLAACVVASVPGS